MRRLALVAAISVLASCQRAPSTADLVSRYTATPDAYEKLAQMIRADIGKRDCFVVGANHIGAYTNGGGGWTSNSDYKTQLPLTGVLTAVGLSNSRYEEYKQMFASTGSEQVQFCQAEPNAPQVSVLIYSTGFVTSPGCYASINWRKVPPTPAATRSNGGHYEIVLLSNGWYFEYDCP